MRDYLGNELFVGSKVIFSTGSNGGSRLHKGIITKIGTKDTVAYAEIPESTYKSEYRLINQRVIKLDW